MSDEPADQPDPLTVQRRARQLQSGFAQFRRPYQWSLVGFVPTVAVGILAGQLSRDVWVAVVVATVLAATTIVIAWHPLTGSAFRASAELFFDHYFHERAEWKKETGSDVPRGIPAARSWLVSHPSGPGRATILMVVGELAEANEAINLIQPKSPEDAFSVEIARKTSELLGGHTPDLSALHATWQALPDPVERRHRRECLALLDAQVAADRGLDPIPALVLGRGEVGQLMSRVALPRFLVACVGLGLLAVAITAQVTDVLLP